MWPFDYFRSQSKLLKANEELRHKLDLYEIDNEALQDQICDLLEEVANLRKRLEPNTVTIDRPSVTGVTDQKKVWADANNTMPVHKGEWVESKPVDNSRTRHEPTMTPTGGLLTGMILGNIMNHSALTQAATAHEVTKKDVVDDKVLDDIWGSSSKVDHTPSQGLHGSPSSSYYDSTPSSTSHDTGSGFSSSPDTFSSYNNDSGFSSSSSGFSD